MAEPILVAKHGDTECFLLPALANRQPHPRTELEVFTFTRPRHFSVARKLL